jgi:HPt (histidine-containing phosphotransfer) domain-containing protein
MKIQNEAVQKYLYRRFADTIRCYEALSRGDLSILERVGHQMKGNGVTFGFPEITDIGESLESAAQKGDSRSALGCIKSLELLLKRQLGRNS